MFLTQENIIININLKRMIPEIPHKTQQCLNDFAFAMQPHFESQAKLFDAIPL